MPHLPGQPDSIGHEDTADQGGDTEVATENVRSPVIKKLDGDENVTHRVTPVYTERLKASTDNDTRNHSTLCGDSYVEAVGQEEWRVTVEGMVLKSQLTDLINMRPATGSVTIESSAYTHRDVNFDTFTYEQTDEMNVGTFTLDGKEVTEPLFRFQLQTEGDT